MNETSDIISSLRSEKLRFILDTSEKENKCHLLNGYLYRQRFNDITDFKILSVNDAKIQSTNRTREGGREHLVFCAPAVRNCTVTICKNPSDGMIYFFHINPELHQSWRSKSSNYQDLFEYTVGKPWEEDRSKMIVTTVAPSHKNDHFTNNGSLYSKYKIIKPFKLDYQFESHSSDESEAERFHVFFDTETEEILCINNKGEVSGPYGLTDLT